MDDRRFDTIIRAFGAGSTRRVVLGGVAASVGGLLAPFSTRSARTQAPCEEGLVDCGGVCVNTGSDPANCGGCGIACGEGGSCDGGSCFFAVGSGTCASSCSAPYVQDPVSCACLCPAGLVDCGGVCAEISADPANCGGCGVVCPSGACVGGACACAAGAELCGGQCVPECSDSFAIDPATCACICLLECGAGQTLDPAACACSDAPTPTAVQEVTTTPEVPATPATTSGVTEAPATTGVPDVPGISTPTTSSDYIITIRICVVVYGIRVCGTVTIEVTAAASQSPVVVAFDGGPPTHLEITQGRSPTGYSTSMRFAEAEGAAPFLMVQGTITPDGRATLAIEGDGVDYQIDLDEATGEIAITADGQQVTGMFNATTGQIEGLTGDMPELTISDAVKERLPILQPAFHAIVVASEAASRMTNPRDGTCFPGPIWDRMPEGIGPDVAQTMGAGCCTVDGPNCTRCQMAAAALASAFPDA